MTALKGRSNGAFTHGATYSPTWWSWTGMKARCRPSYTRCADYSDRGISVCKRWMKFENFLADMGERPEGMTLDRKDNDGNYEPGNCRWATSNEQARNTRAKKLTLPKAVSIHQQKAAGLSTREIGDALGVSAALVRRVLLGYIWKEASPRVFKHP